MITTKQLIAIGRTLVLVAKKDLANKYELVYDWLFVFRRDCPAPYHGRHIELIPIEGTLDTAVRIKAPGNCNGATFVPDSPPGATEASIVHDPFYAELKEIAAAWGWSIRNTRRWGDKCFGAIQRYYADLEDKGKGLAVIYFFGVRIAGRPAYEIGRFARWAKKLFAILICAGAFWCAGSSGGCSVPSGDEVVIPNDPVWEKTR